MDAIALENLEAEVTIIGAGGSAGLASAPAAIESGCKDIVEARIQRSLKGK